MAKRFLAMAVLLTSARAVGGTTTAAPKVPYSIIEMDLYDGFPAGPPPQLENVNLKSLMGVLKYIHTEVITEHETSPPDRTKRKNGIEVIARSRFRIKNPKSVVADPGYPETLVSDVDFGPYMNFMDGWLTSPFQLGLIQRHGDMVGVQEVRDDRFLAREPFYWFSISGWCPNMRDSTKPNRTWLLNDANLELCNNRNNAQCLDTNGTCFWSWSGDWVTSCNIGSDLIPQCFNYTNTSSVTGKIHGGLCPGGANSLTASPTGEIGCAYTYSPLQSVPLDDLVGITKEDCGGRKCKDWADFRSSCSNEKYKQKFVGEETEGAQAYDYCVEYDIHQACASQCTSKACLSIPEEKREVGLPFWRGRCSAKANQVRAEKLAETFGIAGGHRLVSKDLQLSFPTCVHKVPGFCTPAPGQGGMYCSRQWAGVCQPCYIPGTTLKYEAAMYMPVCPYNILQMPEYKGKFPNPECATTQARDLCCMYTSKCDVVTMDPATVPVDDNGYALVASNQSTAAMATFLERATLKAGRTRTTSNLLNFAYYEWGHSPRVGRSLKSVFADMEAQGHLTPAGVPTTTSPTWTTTVTAVITDASVGTRNTGSGGGGLPWWAWLAVILGVAAIGSAIGLALCYACGRVERKKKPKKSSSKSSKTKTREDTEESAGVTAPLVTSTQNSPKTASQVQAPVPTVAVPVTMYSPVPMQASVGYGSPSAVRQATAFAPGQVTSVVAAPPTYSYRAA